MRDRGCSQEDCAPSGGNDYGGGHPLDGSRANDELMSSSQPKSQQPEAQLKSKQLLVEV